jgi:hypothetical protein
MLLLNVQKAIQFEETLQNMLCTNESSNINSKEIGYLRYHQRCNETYNKTLVTHTLHSGKGYHIINMGYQSDCSLSLYWGQLIVFHFTGAIEYIHWIK